VTAPVQPFPEVPFWQEPPERSWRCLDLLDKLKRGRYQPAESTVWMADSKGAKRAGVHEWEWRNVILTAWCERAAAKPDCPWPAYRIPHCPNQILMPREERDYSSGSGYSNVIQAFCTCPEPDTDTWPHGFYHRVHWIARDVPMYCHCGPGEFTPGSGEYGGINRDGYVCESCAPLLITTCWTYGHRQEITEAGHPGEGVSWSHPLKCDCRCCYCGGTAVERRGWRLNGHPPIDRPAREVDVAFEQH
jgi:hypothetical protein